jgi:hypothetical protein
MYKSLSEEKYASEGLLNFLEEVADHPTKESKVIKEIDEMTDVEEAEIVDQLDRTRERVLKRFVVKMGVDNFKDLIVRLGKNEEARSAGERLKIAVQDKTMKGRQEIEDAREEFNSVIVDTEEFNELVSAIESSGMATGNDAIGKAKLMIGSAVTGGFGKTADTLWSAYSKGFYGQRADISLPDDPLGRKPISDREVSDDSMERSVYRKARRELQMPGGKEKFIEKLKAQIAAGTGKSVSEVEEDPELSDLLTELLKKAEEELGIGGSQRPVEEDDDEFDDEKYARDMAENPPKGMSNSEVNEYRKRAGMRGVDEEELMVLRSMVKNIN